MASAVFAQNWQPAAIHISFLGIKTIAALDSAAIENENGFGKNKQKNAESYLI